MQTLATGREKPNGTRRDAQVQKTSVWNSDCHHGYAYAAFAPILHYDLAVADFYGGNFWDMRATGIRLANPAAEQAQGPPVNPVEIGNIDSACVVWKVSQGGYASLVQLVGGAQSFAINWPSNVAKVCAMPAPAPANDPFPVHLSAKDRGTSNATFDHITLAVASYESSSEVSPFSSKFDASLAGNATLSALIGNLGLSPQNEKDLVAFLQTLTDGFVTSPAAPLGTQPEAVQPATHRGN
jgi:cytochrome c peroxidase